VAILLAMPKTSLLGVEREPFLIVIDVKIPGNCPSPLSFEHFHVHQGLSQPDGFVPAVLPIDDANLPFLMRKRQIFYLYPPAQFSGKPKILG
jgi:hypothetical protein